MLAVDVLKRCLATALLAVCTFTACGSDSPSQKPGGQNMGPPRTLACEADDECTGDEPHCDPFSGCVECVLNAHCAEGERCSDARCVTPTECITSSDCADSEPVCNTIVGECVGCLTSADCGESAVCRQGQCEDITPCVNSRDCDGDTVCERDLGYCVQCVGDGDCSEATTCVENSCVPRCVSDNECKGGNLLCHHDVGYCVECVEHVDCPDVYHCRSGRCVVDECIQGEATCHSTLNAKEICDEIGSETELVYCPYETTCSSSATAVQCATWECQPGSARCTESGDGLEVCDDSGLSYTAGMNCADMGGVCEAQACAEVVCEPGQRFCDSGVVYQCAASGTSFTSIQVCAAGQFCNADFGTCAPLACAPGTAICEGTVSLSCRADGSGTDPVTDCADEGELCLNGSCTPEICEAGATYCKDGNVYVCENGGATERVYDTCTSQEYCDDELAICRVRSCTPGTRLCEGEIASVCNESGSGVEADTDCAEQDNQACYLGECLARICTGTRYCKDGNSYACSANGTAESLNDACSASEFCDGSSGLCRPDVCTPGSTGCIDNSVGTCASDGSGFTPTTPCDEDEACISGSCLPIICEASEYYCDGQTIYRCGSDGTTTTLIANCSVNYYCEPGVSSCRPDVCTANQPTCNGALVSTCTANGSGPEPGGTACDAGETCDSGACQPIICTASARFCEAGNVRTCNEFGTASSAYQTCSASTYCNEDVEPVVCSQDICEAGAAACDGETLAVCESDGGGYTSQSTDCSASDMVCNRTECSAAAVDTVGSATSSSTLSNYGFANRYYVTTSRSLTQIEQYISVSGTSQFTWFVFEGTSSSGTYTKIFEKLNTSSGTLHSSGAIDVPLQADRYYLIGVRVAGSAARSYSTQSKTFLSFGHYLNAGYSSWSSSVPSTWSAPAGSQTHYQRLTTALP